MRGRTTLIVGLLALVALAAPATASANWTHGKAELKTNASLGLKGNITLSTSAGNVVCSTELGTTLTGSSSAGHVNAFTVSKPAECDLTGSLAAICGTNGVTKVEKTGTWALTADAADITISSIDIHYTLGGCLIPGIRVKGAATAALTSPHAIGTATLSGTQTLYNSAGEESGSGSLEGTLSASPSGTYGVALPPPPVGEWTHEGSPIAENQSLELNGPLNFSSPFIGFHGEIDMDLNLEAGTGTGTVTSFSMSTCTGTGGASGVPCTATATGLPWTVHATNEGVITVEGMAWKLVFYSNPSHTTPIAETNFSSSNVVAIPDWNEAMSALLIEGTGILGGNPAALESELEVSPPETFGFE